MKTLWQVSLKCPKKWGRARDAVIDALRGGHARLCGGHCLRLSPAGRRPARFRGTAPHLPLAVRQVEEAQDEEGGQQVDEPVHFAKFAAQDLQ